MNGGEVILADEPTGALDSKSGQEVMELLKDLHAQGHTVILVTHDPQVAAHAQRIIRIRDGEILSDEVNADAARSKPAEPGRLSGRRRAFLPPLGLFWEAFKMAWIAMTTHRMRTS